MELPLNCLLPGQCGFVVRVDDSVQIGRRLMQLGLVPGTRVECELTGPWGDPTAYRVRGALLALRRADAALVMLAEVERL